MNINGGPEELATFIRALNDEPVYIVEPPARERVIAPRPAPAAAHKGLSPIVLAFGLFFAIALFLISAHVGVIQ